MELEERLIFKYIHTDSDILCAKYCDDKKTVAVGHIDGSISLYGFDSNRRKLLLTDADTENPDNAVTSVTYRPGQAKNRITSTYSGGVIKQWDYMSGACIFTLREKRQTMGLVFAPKLAKFLTFGDDGKIVLYDEETRKVEGIYEPSENKRIDGHVTKLFAAYFNPALPNEFVTGGWDTTVQFWDIRKAFAVRHLSDVLLGGEGLAINKAGTDLVTCEYKRDKNMKLWDYASGGLIKDLVPDNVSSLLYCGLYLNENFLATGGTDANIFRIVDMRTKLTCGSIKNLMGGVYSLDFLPKRKAGGAKSIIDEIGDLPNILFCCGQYIYEVKFSPLGLNIK